MIFSKSKYSTNWQKLDIAIMMRCVISPLLFVWIIEMILYSANDNSYKKTISSMKAFMDDVILIRVKITYGTNGVPPTRTLQLSRDEDSLLNATVYPESKEAANK